MKGFEEDFFVNMLISQYKLELEQERLKQKMLIECSDFNAVVAFRLFNPPKDRYKNLGIANVVAGFRNLGVKLSTEQAKLII